MQLILARHGESTYSVDGRANGDPSITVPLTPRGFEQARELGQLLSPEPIDECITSAFDRTGETAATALVERAVEHAVDGRWNDIDYGGFEGGPLDEYHRWALSHPLDERVPGGTESRVDVIRRLKDALHHLSSRANGTVLVVTHELLLTDVLVASRAGEPPSVAEEVGYATPHRLSGDGVRRTLERLHRWVDPA